VNLIDVEKQKERNQTSNEVETVHCPRWMAWHTSTRCKLPPFFPLNFSVPKKRTFFAAAAHDSAPDLN